MPGAENAPQDPQLLPPPRLPDARSSLPPDCREENSIIVTLATFPRDSTQTFRFTGDVEGTISRDGASLCRTGLEAPETYSVTQTLPDGWIIRSIQCDERQSTGDIESATATFDLDLGEIVECTFYVQESSTETCHEVVGRWPYGRTYAVAVDGTTAYIGNGASLQVLDVSDPWDPRPLGDVYVPGQVWAIEESGGFLYLAVGGQYYYRSRSLVIVDVRERENPTITGLHPDVKDLRNLEVSGRHVYAASGGSGFKIIDVSDPANPTTVGTITGDGAAVDLEIIDGIAFALFSDGFSDTFSVIDVRDPYSPRVISQTSNLTYGGIKVAVSGKTAYMLSWSSCSINIIDLGDPTAPRVSGWYSTGLWPCPSVDDIDVVGQHLYYLASDDLHVLDVSSPDAPVRLGHTYLQGDALRLSVSGGLAFVATGYPGFGLSVVNVFDPSHPREIGTFTTPLEATTVAISDGFAFLGHGHRGGVRILDISRPGISTEVGFFTTPQSEAVAVVETMVIVAAGPTGLHLFDVSLPDVPTFLGAVNTPGFARDVVIRGDFAYVADGGYGMSIVDISDPSSARVIGTCETRGQPQMIVVDGDLAFLGSQPNAGLTVIDVSDPTAPVVLSNVGRQWDIRDVAVCGGHVCVSDRYKGLLVIDVTDPSRPVQISHSHGLAYYGSLLWHDGYLFAQGSAGLEIIDLADPRRPFTVESIAEGDGGPLASRNGVVGVANSLTGFKVVAPCGGGSN